MSASSLYALSAITVLLLALLVGHLSARLRQLEVLVDELRDPVAAARARRRRRESGHEQRNGQ